MDDISKKRSIVFIDYSNYHYGLQKLRWKIDFLKFKNWLYRNYNIIGLYYYEGIHSQKSYYNSHLQLLHSYSANVVEKMFREYKEPKIDILRN